MNNHFTSNPFITLSVTEGVYYVEPTSIIRLEACSNYTYIHFVNRRPMLISRVLKEFENLLSHFGFVRIHKSHLINTAHIKQVRRSGSIVMNDSSETTISRRKKTEILYLLSGNSNK
jgi:two-component system, LytTR family, response regulator